MTLRGFAILLMSCSLFGHGQSSGTLKETCSLLTTFNGAFDNLDQVQNENSGNEFVQGRFIPTIVSGLGPEPVIFVEEVVNSRILRLNVFAATEGNYRNSKLALYNVTRASLYEKPPGSITVDDVSNLQLEDLQIFDNCGATVTSIDDCLFIVVWQSCSDSPCGIPSHYVGIIRRNDYYVVIPPEVIERSTLVPLYFLRRSPRFPVPGETSYSARAYD